jgi:hypothetical protein
MPLQALECPHCGAPIPPTVAHEVVACAYCGRTLTGVPGASWGMLLGASRDDDDAAPTDPRRVCTVLGRRYLLQGRLASGESTDVYLASRIGRITERVVIKVLRALADADLLAREWKIIHALHASQAQGAAFFHTLLPQPVAKGLVDDGDGIARLALVYRWRSGFQHTVDEITRVHPGGVDARAAVWMWRRVLDLLGWVHQAGHVHGAVLPQHLLVHPRDHGVVLCGWSSATAIAAREPLSAWPAAAVAYYPTELLCGAGGAAGGRSRALPSPATDIAMSARCMARLLGGDPVGRELPGAVPEKLAVLVRAHAQASDGGDAWALRKRVGEIAQEIFGPPRFERFDMPGWSAGPRPKEVGPR